MLDKKFSFGLPIQIVYWSSVKIGLARPGGQFKRYRTAQGHRAGVDVDVTPPTGGPVGHPPQSGDPV